MKIFQFDLFDVPLKLFQFDLANICFVLVQVMLNLFKLILQSPEVVEGKKNWWCQHRYIQLSKNIDGAIRLY